MNMINPENFEELRRDAQPNPALARLMKAWEEKMSKNAKRATGFGLVAVSLAACGSSTDPDPDPDPIDPDPEVGRTLFLSGAPAFNLINVLGALPDGFELAFDDAADALAFLQDVDADINAVPTLTTEESNITVGRMTATDFDDIIITTSVNFNGVFIDAGDGDDKIEVDVINSVASRPLGVVGVETMLVGNQNTDTAVVAGVVVGVPGNVDLFSVLDLTSLTITEDVQGANLLQVTGVRNAADITFSGSFDGGVDVDYVEGVAAINVTLMNVTAENVPMTISHEGGTVNLTTTGDIAVNIVDEANFGSFLQVLNISGDTPLQLGVIDNPVVFRPVDPATIDASEAAGVRIVLDEHNDVTFTGSDNNDQLTVLTADAAVGPDSVIKLNVEMAGGENTLTINADAAFSFVTPDSTILATDGTLDLIVDNDGAAVNRTLDMSQADGAIDVSSIDTVTISDNTTLNLTSAQVATIGITAFSTPDFGNESGSLNIAGVADELLDLSDIDVGQLVSITTAKGDVTFNEDSVLGNINAGVEVIYVDNRGVDSSLTMTGTQFNQLDGTGTVVTAAGGGALAIDALVPSGTNNPVTGQPYETALTIVAPQEDAELNLNNVSVQETTIAIDDGFVAGPDFELTNAAGDTEVTLTLSGDVDLSGAGAGNNLDVDNVTIADGATVSLNAGQVAALGNIVTFEGEATLNLAGDPVNFLIDSDVSGDMSAVTINFTGDGVTGGAAGFVTVTGSEDLTIKGVEGGPDVGAVTVTNALDAGGVLTVSGGSPAVDLGTETTFLTIATGPRTETVFGSEEGTPSIIGEDVTTITVAPGAEATVDLGVLGITSDDLTVNNTSPDEAVTVELTEVPAGADWTFNNVNLVVNEGATFGPGAEITLLGNSTLSGTFDFTELPLADGSLVPINADFDVAAIENLLNASPLNAVTVNATDMSIEQLQAVAAQSEKVAVINGDVVVDATITSDDLAKLAGDFAAGPDDTFTADAEGMSTAQLNAIAGTATTVLNLTVTSDLAAAALDDLVGVAPFGTAIVEAEDMTPAQLVAISDNITKVSVINDMTIALGAGLNAADITRLLSKSPDGETVIDATGMSNLAGNKQYTAIVEQIAKVDVIENLTITAADEGNVTENEFEVLFDNAVDVNVDAAGMGVALLKQIVEFIDKVEDDGISNLTITSELTPDEIDALMGKAVDGEVIIDLDDMDDDQVGAVTDNIDKVAALAPVSVNETLTLTSAQLKALNDAGFAVEGANAGAAGETGGSITVLHSGGTEEIDFTLVDAGTDGGVVDAFAGTLTLSITGGTLVTDGTALGAVKADQNIVVEGGGRWAIDNDVDLQDSDVTITVDDVRILEDAELSLTAEDASAATVAGVDFEKAGAAGQEGVLRAFGGESDDPGVDPKDLTGLNLSDVDVLQLEEAAGTNLPLNPANLPAQIVPTGAEFILVSVNTNWSAYTGTIGADVEVEVNATVTFSAAVAAQMGTDGINVTGEDATVAAETGGSIIVSGLGTAEVDLGGIGGWTPGAGTGGDDNDGVFSIPVNANLTLNPDTVLPPAGANHTIDIANGVVLTVNGSEASQAANNYVGPNARLVFDDLDNAIPVSAGDDVRNVDFVFDDEDTGILINDFKSLFGGAFTGKYDFNGGTGLMRLDVTDFGVNNNNNELVRVVAGDLDNVDADTDAVVIITDGVFGDINDIGFNGVIANVGGGSDTELFFMVQSGPNSQLYFWEDENKNGVADNSELQLVATLNNHEVDSLGADNFIV